MSETTPSKSVTDGSTSIARLIERQPAKGSCVDRMFLLDGDFVSGTAPVIANTHGMELAAGDRTARKLRVFHFNDLHNHLTDLSEHSTKTARFSQMVKRAGVARAAAETEEAVLFLSVGDDHTGSTFDELLGWHEDEFIADAGYRVYSAAGLDVSVLGNHEFDRGSALLAKGIARDADFPLLSANIHSSSHLTRGKDYFAAAIAVVNGLRVGMIGLTTSVEIRIGQPGDLTLAVSSPLDTLKTVVPLVEPLCDVILILSHCGYGEGEHKSGKSAADRDIGEADFSLARLLAANTDKPAAVIGGHTHTPLNHDNIESQNVINGVPILQAGCNGRFLGELTIDLHEDGRRDDAQFDARLHPIIEGETGDEFDKTHIAPLVQKLSGILQNQIAQIETDKLSFMIAAQTRYTGGCALIEFMSDAICRRTISAGYECDFALINGASILAGIERGHLTLGHWFDVMPYPDELMIVSMTTDDLEAILQVNSRRVLRPDEVETTDIKGFLPRGFLHSSHQLRYTLELGGSAADARPANINLNNKPLGAYSDRKLQVAVPAYLSLGAFGERWNGKPITGGVPGNLPGYDFRTLERTSTNLIFRNEIAEEIRSIGILDDCLPNLCDNRVSITSHGGMSHDQR